MNTEPLISLISKYGLSQHQAQILSSAKPAIYIRLDQAAQGDVGQSRIGGTPDLPPSMGWPMSRGHYLCFIAQINLAQLPRCSDSPFPPQGMLYLFVDEGENAAEQILLWHGTEPLQPFEQPNPEEMATDWYEGLAPHTLSFGLLPDIPRWATDDFYALCNNFEIDEEPLDDIARELSRGYVGKLLGHAMGIGHDPRQDAYVSREVNPKWVYDYQKRKTLDMTHAQRWRNLLTVKSSGDVDLWFGDAGYLQVLVHENDLAQMDLSRAYVGLESS
ncbi:MAG: YwqG family protein [Cyanobacteria bacterium J06632_3]